MYVLYAGGLSYGKSREMLHNLLQQLLARRQSLRVQAASQANARPLSLLFSVDSPYWYVLQQTKLCTQKQLRGRHCCLL